MAYKYPTQPGNRQLQQQTGGTGREESKKSESQSTLKEDLTTGARTTQADEEQGRGEEHTSDKRKGRKG